MRRWEGWELGCSLWTQLSQRAVVLISTEKNNVRMLLWPLSDAEQRWVITFVQVRADLFSFPAQKHPLLFLTICSLFKKLFLDLVCVCVNMPLSTCDAGVQFRELILSFCHFGPGNWTQVLWLSTFTCESSYRPSSIPFEKNPQSCLYLKQDFQLLHLVVGTFLFSFNLKPEDKGFF